MNTITEINATIKALSSDLSQVCYTRLGAAILVAIKYAKKHSDIPIEIVKDNGKFRLKVKGISPLLTVVATIINNKKEIIIIIHTEKGIHYATNNSSHIGG
jgi:hypothetical protein